MTLTGREHPGVIYTLAEDTIQGLPLSSYVSISSDTGVIYVLCSFGFEQFHDLQMQVRTSYGGNQLLNSNVSLNLLVLDQKDSAPEILYPTPPPTDVSTGVHSAEPGYLVTKVVALDRDSGQIAWLSYHLLKASEPGLFSVQALLDRDRLQQSLVVVVVQDHGQPPLSSIVTLTVALADSIPDVLADLNNLEVPAYPETSDPT